MKKLVVISSLIFAFCAQSKVLQAAEEPVILNLRYDSSFSVKVMKFEKLDLVQCTIANGDVLRLPIKRSFFSKGAASVLFYCGEKGLIFRREY